MIEYLFYDLIPFWTILLDIDRQKPWNSRAVTRCSLVGRSPAKCQPAIAPFSAGEFRRQPALSDIPEWPYIFYKVDQYKLSPGIITVTLPFPKGDCCTQVWLYIVHVITQCKLTSNMLDWCTLASVKPGLSYIIYIKYTVYRQALWHLNNAWLSEKNLGASWPPSFHFLSPEQVFWLLKIIFKNYWI